MSRVVIVGGGISGLSAAFRLRQMAPDIAVTLLEASDRLGGIVHTVYEDGFVVEAGPDSFLASKPAGLRLCRALGIEATLVSPREENRGSFVFHGGRLHPLPEGLTGLVPSRLDPLLQSELFSPEGKRRLAQEPAVAAGEGEADESLAAFVIRRFGPEVYERLIEPLMAGIYGGDGRLLSLLATFPQLRTMEHEHGSIIRAIASRPPTAPGGPTGFLAPRTGMGTLISALAERLTAVDLRLSTRASKIEPTASAWEVHTQYRYVYSADAVILAVPARIAALLFGGLNPEIEAALASIPSASSAIVSLAYRREQVRHPLRGFGYVVPRATGRPALACTWTSSKWSSRAPEDSVLLRVFLGRYGQDVLSHSDDGLVELARDELQSSIGLAASPTHQWIFRHEQEMPQYFVGHGQRMTDVRALLGRLPGLFLAGNAYGGVGIPDCIDGGEEAADAAIRVIRASPPRGTSLLEARP